MASAPSDIVLESLKKLRDQTSLSDFTIASDIGREWKVHKSVLMFHSDVLFRRATSENFVECQTGRVVLHGFPNDCFEALVIYLYELRVLYIDDDKWTELDGLRDDFYKAYTEYFSSIWRLGDMYNIQPFKDKAFEGFEVLYLIPPDLDFVGGMVDVALRLENFTADLWNVMIGSMADVLKHGQSYDLDETNALWKKHPAFASDVLQVMVKRSGYSWMK